MAKEKGLDIRGTKFFVVGEPLTPKKREEIESAGAMCIPKYHFAEAGCIGCGCNESSICDDIHIFQDSTAVIQHERETEQPPVSVDALLFTSLLPASPKILLNVESDDSGILEKKRCGCKFDDYSFVNHLYNIRSFGKLTSGGMTLVGTDCVQIVEEILPREFGGHSVDYQILEEEDAKGFTHLSIVVSPVIGEIDEDRLSKIVLERLRARGAGRKLLAEIWSQAGTLQVKRAHPIPTKRGKVLPLYWNQYGDSSLAS
jgi:hypothetical protein